MHRPETARFTLEPRGAFSLDTARTLQCGFLRGSRARDARGDRVHLAFPRDGSFDVVGVTLRFDGARASAGDARTPG